MWRLFFILLGLTGFCHARERYVVLLGSDTQDQFKRVLLHYLIPQINHSLDYSAHSFVLYQNKVDSDGLSSLESPFIKRIFIDEIGQLGVVLATKGTDQMSLDELRLLNEILYQINGGIALVNAGAENILTRTLIEQSTFCWATTTIRPDLAVGDHQVKLCNGLKASELSILDSKLTPLHEHVDEIVLPAMPQHRFWPSVFASAEPANQKAKSRHTDQPNARKDRIYGKDKKKTTQDDIVKKTDDKKKPEKHRQDKKQEISEEREEKIDNKLDCKYRKSCYDGTTPPTAEEIKKKYSRKTTQDVGKNVVVSKDASEVDKKLECKYRTSCYKNNGIKLSEANEKKAHQHILTAKHGEVVHTKEKVTLKAAAEKAIKDVKRQEQYAKEHPAEPNYETVLRENHQKLKGKEECKYRKSCYDSGVLTEETIRGIQQSQTAIPQSHKHIDVKDLSDDDKKLKCKYRKSCYETGNIDIDDKRFIRPPVYIAPEEKVHINIDELNDDQKKLRCKYRKSCYETGDLDPEVIKAEQKKNVEPHRSEEFHKLDVMDQKLKCKYRSSCYESGVLPDLTVNYVGVKHDEPAVERKSYNSKELRCKYRKSCYESGHLDVEEKQELPVVDYDYEQPVPTSKADLKLHCKYRPSCYQRMAQEAEEYENFLQETDEDEEDAGEGDETTVIVEEPEEGEEEEEGPETEEVVAEDDQPMEEEESEANEDENDENAEVVMPGKKSKKYTVEPKQSGEETPERPDHMKLKEKKAPVVPKVEEEKSTKKDVERMRKNPDKRFVSKFKKVGNYDKLPKNEQIEDEEELEEEELLEDDEEEITEDTPTPAVSAMTQEENDEDDQEIIDEGTVEEVEEDKEVVDDDDEFIRPADPLRCKYRKSCYRTGTIDLEHTPIYRPSPQSSKSSKSFEELKESDKKLACKYRKHCYDDGVLTEGHSEHVVPHKYHDETEKSEADRKLECKYRKSCYDERPEQREMPHKSDDGKDRRQQKLEPAVVSTRTSSEETLDDDDEDDNKENDEAQNKTVDPNTIPRDARLICKYRHSCYNNFDEEVKSNPALAMKIHGEKCNTYWKSCRDKLGLPVIDRAPVDKQGRKLCRKAKKE